MSWLLVRFFILCPVFFLFVVAKQQQQDDDDYWISVLSDLPDKMVRQAFIPEYLNLDRLINETNASECLASLTDAMDAMIHRREIWAFKLWNSWGRLPPTGFFTGTFTDLGDYDQCWSVMETHHQHPVRYCLVEQAIPMPEPMPLHHNLNHRYPVQPPSKSNLTKPFTVIRYMENYSAFFYLFHLRLGVCLPQTCNANDVRQLAQPRLEKIGLRWHSVKCEDPPEGPWRPSPVQWLAIIGLGAVLIITIMAFIYDQIVQVKKCVSWETALLWFHPGTNIRKLFATDPSRWDELQCIHGIRTISMMVIIMAHTLEWNDWNNFKGAFVLRERMTAIRHQPLLRSHYTVETFFYMSGLLTSYVLLRHLASRRSVRFPYVSYILFRYLRLTPQLMAFMALFSLIPPMFDGPLWKSTIESDLVMGKCHETWWRNLLYIQNLFGATQMCGVHTWFLAVDMQLHLIVMFPLAVLVKNRQWGIVCIKLMILLATIGNAIVVYTGNIPPGGIVTNRNDFSPADSSTDEPEKYLYTKFFFLPWNHSFVYLFGLLLGVHLSDGESPTMTKTKQMAGWIAVTGCWLFYIYSTYPYIDGRPYNPAVSAILSPLNQLIWATMLTLLIRLCLTAKPLLPARLFSWPVFRPLSRMTYSVYLVHALVVYVALGTRRQLLEIGSDIEIILLTIGTVAISYTFGAVFCLLFESPLVKATEVVRNRWNTHGGHRPSRPPLQEPNSNP